MVAVDSYLCLGGLELNGQQAAYYGSHGWAPGRACVKDCCGCPGLDLALGYVNGWTTPANDGAPWYDPTEPDSYDFGGLVIQEITGLGAGKLSREVKELAGEGAVITRGRRAAPVITVTGILMGRTPCGVAYGHRWLDTALRGSCVGNVGGCVGEDLRYLNCCPGDLDEDCPDVADHLTAAYEQHYAPHWRTLKQAALVGGVEVIERLGNRCTCGCGGSEIVRVQFTLAAGRPCVYRDPIPVITGAALIDGAYDDECFTWIRLADGEECPPDEHTCVEPADCTFDPSCRVLPPPPPLPVPVNACTTCTPFTRRTLCLTLPGDVVPAWTEGAVTMELYAGSQPLRHVQVRFWPNPLGRPVEELPACSPCAELNLASVPAYSTFVMDGTEQTTTVQCPGSAPTNAASLLGGPPGRLFSHPVIECGGVPYSVCIRADGESVAPDATVSITITPREC